MNRKGHPMSTHYRKISSADIYHIIIRGSGKQIIFEDDDDRRLFLRLANKYIKELEGEALAWILMSNHVHMILHMKLEAIATLMCKMGATYFVNFNKKTGRTGYVLQDRFHSEPINTDGYLMTCVRYVHQNIEKAGVCEMENYPWSSYGSYLGTDSNSLLLETGTDFVLAIFEGADNFTAFHATRDFGARCIDVGKTGKRMTDEEALIVAKSLLGETAFCHLKKLEKPGRDPLLQLLKENGLSSYQIGRLTGIGVGIIKRA